LVNREFWLVQTSLEQKIRKATKGKRTTYRRNAPRQVSDSLPRLLRFPRLLM
jgi:hypothetical protein